jgi:hypothetical protein
MDIYGLRQIKHGDAPARECSSHDTFRAQFDNALLGIAEFELEC